MSTKAQLEAEIIKMTEERQVHLRQIKNLKKRKNVRPAAIDNKSWSETETVLKDKIVVLNTENARLLAAHSTKDKIIEGYKNSIIAITNFANLSWFERLTWSKADIKKLL